MHPRSSPVVFFFLPSFLPSFFLPSFHFSFFLSFFLPFFSFCSLARYPAHGHKCRDNHLYVLGPECQPQRVLTAGGPVSSRPAFGQDGTTYFGAQDGYLHAYLRRSTSSVNACAVRSVALLSDRDEHDDARTAALQNSAAVLVPASDRATCESSWSAAYCDLNSTRARVSAGRTCCLCFIG